MLSSLVSCAAPSRLSRRFLPPSAHLPNYLPGSSVATLPASLHPVILDPPSVMTLCPFPSVLCLPLSPPHLPPASLRVLGIWCTSTSPSPSVLPPGWSCQRSTSSRVGDSRSLHMTTSLRRCMHCRGPAVPELLSTCLSLLSLLPSQHLPHDPSHLACAFLTSSPPTALL